MSPVLLTQIVARVVAVVQVALGIVVWTGHGDSLIPVHVAVGLAVLALVWSVGMPAFGLVQANVLSGDLHVLVQAAHLVVGLAAVGLVESLARSGRRRDKVAA